MYSRSAGYTIDILVQRSGGGQAGGRGAEEASGAGWAVEVDELGDFVKVLLKPLTPPRPSVVTYFVAKELQFPSLD